MPSNTAIAEGAEGAAGVAIGGGSATASRISAAENIVMGAVLELFAATKPGKGHAV